MAAFLKRRTGRTNGRTGNTQSQPGLNLDTEILQKMKILALPYVTVWHPHVYFGIYGARKGLSGRTRREE